MNRRERRDALVLDELGHVAGELALIADGLSKAAHGPQRGVITATRYDLARLEQRIGAICRSLRPRT